MILASNLRELSTFFAVANLQAKAADALHGSDTKTSGLPKKINGLLLDLGFSPIVHLVDHSDGFSGRSSGANVLASSIRPIGLNRPASPTVHPSVFREPSPGGQDRHCCWDKSRCCRRGCQQRHPSSLHFGCSCGAPMLCLAEQMHENSRIEYSLQALLLETAASRSTIHAA